jgi:hypothetical protein
LSIRIMKKEQRNMNRQGTAEVVRGEEKSRKRKELISVSADRADFKEMFPGISRAVLWGDPDLGRYSGFTKFVPGFDAGMHTHTNDVWLVVLKGAYLYKDVAGEKRAGPGEFLWIPGRMKPWSGGDANEGALFYEEASGKFDLVPVT